MEAIAGMAIVAALALALIALIIIPRFRLNIEKGRSPKWTGMCQVRFGRFSGSNFSGSRVSVYDEFVVIAAPFPRAVESDEIASVEKTRGFLRDGVEIRLRERGGAINIFPTKPEPLFSALRSVASRAKPANA